MSVEQYRQGIPFGLRRASCRWLDPRRLLSREGTEPPRIRRQLQSRACELAAELRTGGRLARRIEDDEIVGHILFSELPIETNQGALGAVSLAPITVNPKCQRQGIGSALVRQL
jgi:predicted N-acetyltransferase YhbS